MDDYLIKKATLYISKLYATSTESIMGKGFIDALYECLKNDNAIIVDNAMTALY